MSRKIFILKQTIMFSGRHYSSYGEKTFPRYILYYIKYVVCLGGVVKQDL